MIYLVTKTRELFPSDAYEVIDAAKALEIMKDWEEVQFDTETTGLNCHLNKLLCMQFGNGDIQIVVDSDSYSPVIFKNILEEKLIIGHNLKFDLQFLYNYEVIPQHVYDTMIAEQTMYMGFPYTKVWRGDYEREGYDFPVIEEGGLLMTSYSLKALCKKYLHQEMDKQIREQIPEQGLSNLAVILYSANDVKYLQQLRNFQLETAKKKTMEKAIQLECAFIPTLAYMEWCGVHLDEQKWGAKMKKDNKNLEDATKALNDFVIRTPELKQYTHINLQGDLFSGFNTEPIVGINWGSSKQVIPVCKILGFNTATTDKKTGLEKDTVLEKELSVQKGINDEFLDLYFKYQEYAKVVSSFGQTWLNSINPVTGRLHTKFNQLGASSGRLSCGGGLDNELAKYKKLLPGSCKLLNLQQLPHDEETRACFTAEKGNLWCSCDFSSEEARLTADVSGDKEYHKEFTERTGDTHAMFAWACYEKECRQLGCTSAAEVKSKAKFWRNKVKPAEFAYTFSATAPTIAKTAGIPLEQAEEMVANLNSFFSGLTDYKKRAAAETMRLGYIEICPETGHKLWWWDYNKWKREEKLYKSKDWSWDDYRQNHKGTGDDVCKQVKEHFSAMDKYSKLSLNSRTQGRGAIIFKESGINLFKWIITHNCFNKIKMCVGVHDKHFVVVKHR